MHREVTFVYRDRPAWTEADVPKRSSVFAQGDFVFCATVKVIKYGLPQAPAGETPEILYVDDFRRSERIVF